MVHLNMQSLLQVKYYPCILQVKYYPSIDGTSKMQSLLHIKYYSSTSILQVKYYPSIAGTYVAFTAGAVFTAAQATYYPVYCR